MKKKYIDKKVLSSYPESWNKLFDDNYSILQRKIMFQEINQSHNEEIIYTLEDGGFHFIVNSLILRCSNTNIYISKKPIFGITYQNNKIKYWKGKNHETLFKFLNIQYNINWFPRKLNEYLNNNYILKKIIKKEITNPHDLAKYIIKLYKYNISPKELLLLHNKYNVSKHFLYRYHTIFDGNLYNSILKFQQINQFGFENVRKSEVFDLLDQCFMLNKKINIYWSEKRLMRTHGEFSKIISDAKKSLLDNTPIIQIENLPNKFTQFKNLHELYDEGNFMSHCIFSNYHNKIQLSNYFAFHCNYNNEDITIGIKLVKIQNEFEYKVDQIKGIKNSKPSKEILDYIDSDLKQLINLMNESDNIKRKECI